MIKINCSNPICGKSFHYDETKFPNAKKVKCPHCQTVQPLDFGNGNEQKDAAAEEWYRSEPPRRIPPGRNLSHSRLRPLKQAGLFRRLS